MPVRRNTIRINFVQVPTLLKELVVRIPETTSFIRGHGSLLSLVTSKLDEQMMSVLVQFYDPLYHCFTFQDFQLVPTLEEFSGKAPFSRIKIHLLVLNKDGPSDTTVPSLIKYLFYFNLEK